MQLQKEAINFWSSNRRDCDDHEKFFQKSFVLWSYRRWMDSSVLKRQKLLKIFNQSVKLT